MSRIVKQILSRMIAFLLLASVMVSGCALDFMFDRDMMLPFVPGKIGYQEDSQTDTQEADDEVSESGVYASDFDLFAREVFIFFMKDNTLELNRWVKDPLSYGIEETVSYWPDYSPERIEEKYDEMQVNYDHLLTFDEASLSRQQQITYEYLWAFLEGELSVRENYLLYDPLSYYSGRHLSMDYSLSTFVIRDRDDIELYFKMIEGLDDYVEGLVAFQVARSEAGYFMNYDNAQRVIDSCKKMNEDIEYRFITVFEERIDSFDWLTDQEKEDYKEQNRSYVRNHVRAAFRTIIQAITELEDTGSYGRGLSRFEGGTEYFERQVQKMTGSRRSVDEFFQLLERHLGMWEIQFRRLNRQVSFEAHEEIYYPYITVNCVIENNLEHMEGRFPLLENMIDEYFEVYEVPILYEESIAGMYLYAPVDDPWHNIIYVNRRFAEGLEFYEIVSHEAIPGHLYQTVYFITSDAKNMELRYWLSAVNESLATLEGWTTYIESVSHEMAGLSQQEREYLAAQSSLYLISMSIIDIGIHYYGWTRQDAVNYFRDRVVLDVFTIEDYIFDELDCSPASYVAYAVGYIDVIEMINEAQNTLGDQYSEYDFHTFYMDMGMCTMDTMKREFDIWLDEQAQQLLNAA